jgi:hypothetical protein
MLRPRRAWHQGEEFQLLAVSATLQHLRVKIEEVLDSIRRLLQYPAYSLGHRCSLAPAPPLSATTVTKVAH